MAEAVEQGRGSKARTKIKSEPEVKPEVIMPEAPGEEPKFTCAGPRCWGGWLPDQPLSRGPTTRP